MQKRAFAPRSTLGKALSLLVLLALAAPLVLPASALAAPQALGLSSGSFEFNVASGQVGKGELDVYSDSDVPLNVMVYASNQTVDATGNATFSTPSKDPSDYLTNPAAWLQVKLPAESKSYGNIPYLEVKPKQRIPVSFSFEVPEGVPPGDHQVILFFETFEFPNAKSQTGSTIRGRLGARIRMRVQGEFIERLQVEPFVVPQLVIGDSLKYSFVLRNMGNLDKTLDGQLQLLNRNEEVVAGAPVLKERVVYASTMLSEDASMSVAGLAPGLYTARLEVSFQREAKGGTPVPDSVRKERQVWVLPLWLVIVVGAVLFLALAWGSWRISVRSAMRKMRSERASNGDIGTAAAEAKPEEQTKTG